VIAQCERCTDAGFVLRARAPDPDGDRARLVVARATGPEPGATARYEEALKSRTNRGSSRLRLPCPRWLWSIKARYSKGARVNRLVMWRLRRSVRQEYRALRPRRLLRRRSPSLHLHTLPR